MTGLKTFFGKSKAENRPVRLIYGLVEEISYLKDSAEELFRHQKTLGERG